MSVTIDRAALRALPFHVHLIKYDPSRATGRGYNDGSWTSISDVGQEFSGETLTRDEYERVEQVHLDALAELARESEIDRLHLLGSRGPRTLEITLAEVRASMREETDATIWFDENARFYIAVGYDYHVYCGSHRDCSAVVARARARGLHPRVDDGPSPWLDEP